MLQPPHCPLITEQHSPCAYQHEPPSSPFPSWEPSFPICRGAQGELPAPPSCLGSARKEQATGRHLVAHRREHSWQQLLGSFPPLDGVGCLRGGKRVEPPSCPSSFTCLFSFGAGVRSGAQPKHLIMSVLPAGLTLTHSALLDNETFSLFIKIISLQSFELNQCAICN